ncbi:hypothetical protein BCR36DRAFT_278395, partial [Piromyces finnis]
NIRISGGFEEANNCYRNHKDYIFAVKGPFINKRIVNSNSGENEKRHIINEFSRAYNILKDTGNLNDILKNDDIL